MVVRPQNCALLSPDAIFTTNSNPPNTIDKVLPLLSRRSERLARFESEVHAAWDLGSVDAAGGSAGRRTVLYESTSTTVFKGDPMAHEARVKEFSVVELRLRGDGSGGFEAIELRTVMDPSPVTALAQAIVASKT
ncbi:hypothetical protein MGN70_003155 [Eutypa lata]|nr:hypothetical protein MGN70_003155 [Eutypa lata]